MGFLSNKEKFSQARIGDPRKLFTNLLNDLSGETAKRELKYHILYNIFAFRGICDGLGTSTIVANTALAVAELGLTVCVVDTSILNPVQDIYLGTDREADAKDWFDMPYASDGYLHQSKFHKNISVLSFANRDRIILDAIGIKDSSSLVSLMVTTLLSKFDIILIDCCSELTEINTACLQQAHRVFQIWNDSYAVLSNLDRFITNNTILTCPLDKMRDVILSKKDALSYGGKIDDLLEKFKLNLVGFSNLSLEIASIMNQGKLPFDAATRDKDVEIFSTCILAIVNKICRIDDVDTKKETVTSEDLNKKGQPKELVDKEVNQ